MAADNVLPILRDGTVLDQADACRSAALGFMAGAPDWGKRELAEWLEESYRPLTVPLMHRAVHGNVSRIDRPRIEGDKLRHVVESAHANVASELRSLEEKQSALEFGRALIHSSWVTRCIDERGELGWTPIASSRMPLAKRVMSLFAADFLARPWDYESALHVCISCDKVRLVDATCCERVSGGRPIVPIEDVA
jgi:hypothetical protein